MPSKMRPSRLLLPLIYNFIRGLLFHVPICYKLGFKLFRSLTAGTYLWVIMLARLIIFTVVLLPGWIGMVKYWIFSPKIIRNVEYGHGARKRNLLDVYLPADCVSGCSDVPVVVFVTGGAWIIGYKLWCALIGRGLSSMGVLTIVPDYRNFPQGDIQDMVADIVAAVSWTSKNARQYGGNPEKIVLAGQSAGAHICMCALVDSLRRKVDDRKNNLNFRISEPSSKSLDNTKSYLPKKSMGKKSTLSLNSPDRSYFRHRKTVGSLSPISIPDEKGFESEGNITEESDVDTEAEVEDDNNDEDNSHNENDDDDDCATWKSSSPCLKQPLNSHTPESAAGGGVRDRDVSYWKRKDRKSGSSAGGGMFSRFESPQKVKEIQVMVGSAIKSIGEDVKEVVESVYRGIKENVHFAAVHLHEIEVDLRSPKVIDPYDDHDVLQLSEIKLFIGVSGPYNLQALSSHMQSRGLDHSILKWICRGDIEKYSPTLQLDAVMAQMLPLVSPRTASQSSKHQAEKKTIYGKSSFDENFTAIVKDGFVVTKNFKSDTSMMNMASNKRTVLSSESELLNASCKSSLSGGGTDCDLNEEEEEEISKLTLRGLHFPPVALFHGAKDSSVPSNVSVEMAASLCRWGGEVYLRMYEGWAHTDAILEGPLTGDNALCEDIITQIRRAFPNTPVSTTAESSSSRASFDASGNFLSSSSTSNSHSQSQSNCARSRTNSIPQSLIHLTSSASMDNLFPSEFNGNMSERIPVSVLKGNGTALIDSRNDVWARAVCSRCSLRCSASNVNNAQNSHGQCHDSISDILEQNGRYDSGHDRDLHNLLNDTGARDKSIFLSKCESRVSHVVAVPVPAPVSEAHVHGNGNGKGSGKGNGNGILPSTDSSCFGTELLKTQEEERRCSCYGTQTNTHTNSDKNTNPNEDMLVNALNYNKNKKKKGDIGFQSCDSFADCRVPSLLVGVARWVNPF